MVDSTGPVFGSKHEENGGTRDASRLTSSGELANDVALLYSWAKIENTPYRDFSRQRTSPESPLVDSGKKSETIEVKTGRNGSDTPTQPYADVSGRESLADEGPQLSVHEVLQAGSGGPHHPNQLVSQEFAKYPNGATRPMFCDAEPPAKVAPVLAVYSVAGGVGKTTICANLGKILCSLGEQILLVDATGRGLLPFYFGATEPRTGLRKFAAPGVNASFVQIITGNEATAEWLDRDVKHLVANSQRTIVDLGYASQALIPAVLSICTVVLVPLLPDLNSVISVPFIENFLNSNAPTSNSPEVFYFFNCFDESSAHCQQARDFVLRHCGSRLLPIGLRKERESPEAPSRGGLYGADRMPGPELSHDYMELAAWVRRVAPLRAAALIPGRWSEQ